jgi:hypothetical protein
MRSLANDAQISPSDSEWQEQYKSFTFAKFLLSCSNEQLQSANAAETN